MNVLEDFVSNGNFFRRFSSVLLSLLFCGVVLTGCLSVEARKAIAPPVSVVVHVDSGNAIISGEISTNPNAFVDSSERTPEGYMNRTELDTELFVAGTEFSCSITYGSALTLFVRPANDATEENPLVFTVTEGSRSKTYTVSGFQAVKMLRFSNDYPIG